MKKHIFFDLDHTLWDFDRNAEETLLELYEKYELQERGVKSAAQFIEIYTENNHRLWAEYHLGKVTKDYLRENRFKSTFLSLGMNPENIPYEFEDEYVNISPTKTKLFEGAVDVLNYLQEKYTLHIISNGFKTTTTTKLQVCDLNKYFKNVFISEDIGHNKPSPHIFKQALEVAGAFKEEAIMIGDSLEADIYGALNFGMDAIFFNPTQKLVPEDVPLTITHLKELQEIF
ncbi:YjjG family noncanonical pyrimidine nucleotidase [Pedobacter flavus]|uniref:YjjG family noncanonical pyrimidine nucleotidase n=1 Tax=Pedobacter flavus TaxID=3113906 RepID=A0ABU7H095_9SPHI|nr:YjjG family noncanonical pyrimidine nucleotidase [Pedobacter sp. VNH31]MEE1884669.1 YjjG family noncanonical pyrimidine nucleotidase [Pedobacter sp. VNH31]